MTTTTDDDVSTQQAPPPPTKRQRQASRFAEAASVGVKALLVKIVLLGLVDAIAIYAMFVLFTNGQWLVGLLVVAVAALFNWIYFSRKKLPSKYLAPGVLFLAVFQVFTLLYTGYIAFTNYGTGHNGSQDQAVSALMSSALERVEDSPTFAVTIVDGGGTLNMLVTDPDGEVSLGNNDTPLHEVDATMENGTAVATDGYTTLSFQEVIARTDEITALSVPASDDPNDGALRTPDGSSAYLYLSTLEYDEAAGTMTDVTTGIVYSDIGTGAFTSDDGQELLPGWQVNVGFDNFVRAFTEESDSWPAHLRHDLDLRVRDHLRRLDVLPRPLPRHRLQRRPHAGPEVVPDRDDPAVRVPRVPLRPDLGGHDERELRLHQPGAPRRGIRIPWLTDPTLAKVSVLIVNLWLGFPYMFLVCTGALQSIPEELTEAATVDGARPWAIFRLIKLPLLLVTVTPLLIASFAFNFNNFVRDLRAHERRAARHQRAHTGRLHRHPHLDGLQGRLHRPEP